MEIFHLNKINSELPVLSKTPSAPSPPPFESTPTSYAASLRRLKHLPSARVQEFFVPPRAANLSPTQRFISARSIQRINFVLRQYGMTNKDLALFKKIVAKEGEGFLGYQAGSSTVRLFQDILFHLVKDVLQIPIKDDFVFLRVPGDPTFLYESAVDFLAEKGQDIPPFSWDNEPEIRQHILSLNLNLYQSYDAPWDLTPRYFLENQTWTHANVREIITPFFASLGIDENTVDSIWNQALDLLPHNRGYILQFFDQSSSFAFTKEHSYIAHSGGKPNSQQTHHQILSDPFATNFPQMRLVMANQSTLNPFSSLSIKRYDAMTDPERYEYNTALKSLLQGLSFDSTKVRAAREKLLTLWTNI
jgi:hypothetical protein